MPNLYIEWENTNNEFVDGYEIHASNTSGFTPDDTTLLGTVAPTVNMFESTIDNGTWFFVVKGFNEFFESLTGEVERTIDCDAITEDGIIAVAYVR